MFGLLTVVTVIASGCAGTEEKMGRGITNATEPARMGEMSRSIEQSAEWDGPMAGYTTGVVKGFDHTLERTGLGVVEIITAPFPPYHPIFTKYVPAAPGYPDNNPPSLPDDPALATDTYIGFSGGDEGVFFPGCTFNVYNH